ncbi:hypothetical protein MMC20_005414 [Loxospora ochrophaea]|nr:hypothetical protein [Loxospora ochrophaea]
MRRRERHRGSDRRDSSRSSQGPILRRSGRARETEEQQIRRSSRISALLDSRGEDPTQESQTFSSSIESRGTGERSQRTCQSNAAMHAQQTFHNLQQSIAGQAQATFLVNDGLSGTTVRAEDPAGTTNEPGSRSSNGLNMDIILQPPSRIRPSEDFAAPVIVRLRSMEGVDRDIVDNPESLWATVELVSEDGRTTLSPPRSDLVTGSTWADSLQSLGSDQGDRELGYLRFPTLAIRRPGQYRFRICLRRTVWMENRPDVLDVQSALTRLVRVDPAAPDPMLSECFDGIHKYEC